MKGTLAILIILAASSELMKKSEAVSHTDLINSCESQICYTGPYCFGYNKVDADKDDKCYKEMRDCTYAFGVVNQFDVKTKMFTVHLVGTKKGNTGAWVALVFGDAKASDVFKDGKVAIICSSDKKVYTTTKFPIQENDEKTLKAVDEKSFVKGTKFEDDGKYVICKFELSQKVDDPELKLREDKKVGVDYKIGLIGSQTRNVGTGKLSDEYKGSSKAAETFFKMFGADPPSSEPSASALLISGLPALMMYGLYLGFGWFY